MCALLTVLLTGPRVMIVLLWLILPGRYESAFSTPVLPVLGFFFLPWLTLAFVLVAPGGHVEGYDWLWLAIAFAADWFTHLGGVFGRRLLFGTAHSAPTAR